MSAIEQILDNAETNFDAACEIGRALMRGNRAQFQAGYSAESAAITACNVVALSGDEMEAVRNHLLGFAVGIAEDSSNYLPTGS